MRLGTFLIRNRLLLLCDGSENYDVNENFFRLVQVDANTAEYLYSSLKDFFSSLEYLISLRIPFSHCWGQGYDGARNFQSCISGVAKRFENENK